MIDLSLYTIEYFSKRFRADRQKTFKILGSAICNHIIFNSFVDMGCATGEITTFLLRNGKKGYGIELSSAAFKLMPDFLQNHVLKMDVADCELPNALGHVDLAICLEVAEHLPESRAMNLINNLCQISDTIMFSAATPGQGGTGHLNEQPWDYWRLLFASEGYTENLTLSQVIRESLNEEGARHVYIKNTRIMYSAE